MPLSIGYGGANSNVRNERGVWKRYEQTMQGDGVVYLLKSYCSKTMWGWSRESG